MSEKSTITYDDFKKLDIRIGKIVAAERVPETDKLIKCAVEVSDGAPRTIVSGIAEYVSPEDLIGRKFPYLLNLEPRVIRGVESQGMILAVGGEEFSLLSPDNPDVTPGAAIS